MKNSKEEHIISVFTENHPGILFRVAAVFLRRKINIESFKVSDSPVPEVSLFTIVVVVDEGVARVLVRQIDKIVGVLRSEFYTARGELSQEVALFRVRGEIFRGGAIEDISRRHPLRLLQIGGESGVEGLCRGSDGWAVLRKSGYKEEIDALRDELAARGLLVGLSRSGSVILHREAVEGGLLVAVENEK